MSELELKYNYKKIVFYIVFSIIFTIFFSYTHLNADELALETPKNGIHSWVGHIFYQNEKLLLIFSLCFVLLFIYGIFYLVNLLFTKSLIIRNELNNLYVNNKKVVSISNIKTMKIVNVNNAVFIHIHFKKIQNSKIEKYLPLRLKKYSNKDKYILNLAFLKLNPNEVYLLLKKNVK